MATNISMRFAQSTHTIMVQRTLDLNICCTISYYTKIILYHTRLYNIIFRYTILFYEISPLYWAPDFRCPGSGLTSRVIVDYRILLVCYSYIISIWLMISSILVAYYNVL